MDTKATSPVYLVPLIDVNWVNFSPLDPARGYKADPAPVEQCLRETEETRHMMRELVNGKYVITPHSGTYNRNEFYKGDFLESYRKAIEDGAELAIHLHEEIQRVGTRYDEKDHVTRMIRDRKAELDAARIPTVGYRGGLFAYVDYLTEYLEEQGLYIDLSCAPGLNEPHRHAVWTGAPTSGFYIPKDGHTGDPSDRPSSEVFEIPIASDGFGTARTNYLYVEVCSWQQLMTIWDATLERAAKEAKPQIVRALFHTSSTPMPEFRGKFEKFIQHAGATGARFATPTEAKRLYDSQAAIH